MKNKRFILIMCTAVVLLLVPLVAMQFTNEVVWTVQDFAAMSMLLFGVGILLEVILRNVKRVKPRFFILAALFLTFFLVWMELAVGIVGSPFAGS